MAAPELARLADRAIEPDAPRAVAGENFVVAERKVRSTRRLIEPGRPAPLLMRVMLHKTALDTVRPRRQVVREARPELHERVRLEVPLRVAQEERGDLDRPNPVGAWRGEDPRRGMRAARPCLPGGTHG